MSGLGSQNSAMESRVLSVSLCCGLSVDLVAPAQVSWKNVAEKCPGCGLVLGVGSHMSEPEWVVTGVTIASVEACSSVCTAP